MYWDDSGIIDDDLLITRHYYDYDRETGQLTLDYIAAYDELTGECSARTILSEEFLQSKNYSEITFFFPHNMPAWKGEELLDCREWPESENMHGMPIPIDEKWHFEVCDIDAGKSLLSATILIEDTQGIGHCSPLCILFPDLTQEVHLTQVVTEQSGESIVPTSSTARWNSEVGCLNLQLTLPDLPPELYHLSVENIVLNGTLSLPDSIFRSYRAGEDLQIGIGDQMLSGLQDLSSIEFDLEVRPFGFDAYGTAHVRYLLSEPLPVGVSANE